MTRQAIATAIVAAMLAIPAVASADETTCVENGEAGIVEVDGGCLTATEYDAIYSVENLSKIPSAINPELSIAEEAGLIDTGVAASEIPRGDGLVPVAEQASFVEYVEEVWVKATGGYFIV